MQEMYDHLESTPYDTTQLYVETHQMRCCATLLLVDLQGSQCLLSRLRLSHHLDVVKQVNLLVMRHKVDVLF